MPAVRTTPGAVDATCAAGRAKGMAPTSSLWPRCPPTIWQTVRGNPTALVPPPASPPLRDRQRWCFFPLGSGGARARRGPTDRAAYAHATPDTCALHRDLCPVRFAFPPNLVPWSTGPHCATRRATPCCPGRDNVRACGCVRAASACVTVRTMAPPRRGPPMARGRGAGVGTHRRAGRRCAPPPDARDEHRVGSTPERHRPEAGHDAGVPSSPRQPAGVSAGTRTPVSPGARPTARAACRPLWRGSGRRNPPTTRLVPQPAQPHVGGLSRSGETPSHSMGWPLGMAACPVSHPQAPQGPHNPCTGGLDAYDGRWQLGVPIHSCAFC